MTDVTPIFSGFLKQHEVSLSKKSFDPADLEDFLQEAYRINSNIALLHRDLRNIRQSYLSTAQPRRTLLRGQNGGATKPTSQPLTDHDREVIDAKSKQMLRELNASIRTLADAEALRRDTEMTLLRKKHSSGLGGALGAWAAGGGLVGKSAELMAAEERANAVASHRESVLWTLRQRLQECVRTQQGMMEVRLKREMEKSASVLAKASGREASSLSGFDITDGSASAGRTHRTSQSHGLPPPDGAGGRQDAAEGLTAEQLQMFEEENNAMLQHYESTLDQVRTAEKSLIEISEMQTQLVNNLATQSEHIDKLVADSFNTTENVGGGNKQLTRAAKRPSMAKYTFYATCGVCTFLVVWDLIF